LFKKKYLGKKNSLFIRHFLLKSLAKWRLAWILIENSFQASIQCKDVVNLQFNFNFCQTLLFLLVKLTSQRLKLKNFGFSALAVLHQRQWKITRALLDIFSKTFTSTRVFKLTFMLKYWFFFFENNLSLKITMFRALFFFLTFIFFIAIF